MISTRKYLEALRQDDHEARNLARVDINRRLEQMNELRDQINVERAGYLDRTTYEARHQLLETEIDANRDRLGKIEAAYANLQGRLAVLGGITALATGLITAGAIKLFGG